MKGAIKTEEIHGIEYDIVLQGVEEAIEAKSIMMSLILDSGMPLDDDIDASTYQMYLMKGLTRKNVSRIKELFVNCITAPKIDDESFSKISDETIPVLFNAVYEYQVGSADKKKVSSKE